MPAESKNSRNAAFLINNTDGAGATYTKVNKTHGLAISNPTDYSEDTGHGQKFKSYKPGLADFTVTLAKWYRTLEPTLKVASLKQIPYYGLIYMDYADPTNYWKGIFFITLNSQNMDLGNTIDETYDVRLSDQDPVLVVDGTAVTL